MRAAAGLVLGVVAALAAAPLRAACEPDIESHVVEALDTYLAGLNSRDAASWAATLRYPQVRIRVDAAAEIWPTPEAYAAEFRNPREFAPGWDRSEWSSVEVLWCDPRAAYARVHYLDVDATDSVQSSLQGMFVLTREGGAWGVQARVWDVVPAEGELASEAERGARHGLEEFLAGQQSGSGQAMAASMNLPTAAIADGDVRFWREPSAVVNAVAAGGPDLCGPLPELSESLIAARTLVVMAGHLPRVPGTDAVPMPNLYVLTSQDGHWGVTGCATFSGPSTP